MPYTDNIPQSGQTLGQTQANINTNFTIIRTVQKVNHEDFDNANQGKHKFLQMPEQGAGPTTAVNEAGFYSKPGTNPVETNLFFRAENSGFEYQLTKSIAASTGSFATSTGWTFLPGGLIMQYGVVNNPSGGASVNYPITFPNAVFGVFFNFGRNASGVDSFWINTSGTNDNTQFTYKASTSSAVILYWMAIGN